MLPTNEELMIARHTRALLGYKQTNLFGNCNTTTRRQPNEIKHFIVRFSGRHMKKIAPSALLDQ
jgi:hypothetical protein